LFDFIRYFNTQRKDLFVIPSYGNVKGPPFSVIMRGKTIDVCSILIGYFNTNQFILFIKIRPVFVLFSYGNVKGPPFSATMR
jgi:hypothetical protein